MIKVSIIVPTYKRPDVTAKCLELLSKSEYLNDKFQAEVVIVDSSPDQSIWDKIKDYQKFFEIQYNHLEKQTMPGEARNLAVKKSKNGLIISLDSDIEVKPETTWQMISYCKNHPTVGKLTGKSIFSTGEKKEKTDRPTKWDRTFKRDGTVYIEGIYGRYEAFYKSLFLSLGGYDPIFGACGEGTDMSVRFWRAGFPLGIDENIIAYHNSEAPESLRRVDPDRMTSMYRSLFLVAYKYDVGDIELSTNFIKSHEERYAAYGDTIEFHSIVSAAKSIEWFKENYDKIIASKNAIPKEYDFKPFDIFSNKKSLELCLANAQERIVKSYKKVFER